MASTVLVANTGRPTGSAASRRMRAEDVVPAVLYGHGMAPLSVTVDRRELRHALTGPAGVNAVIDLQVGDATHHTVVKELQRHPIKRMVTHVDFLVVRMDEAITVDVPIELEGEAKAVLAENGIIEQLMHTLAVDTTPAGATWCRAASPRTWPATPTACSWPRRPWRCAFATSTRGARCSPASSGSLRPRRRCAPASGW